MRRTPVLLLGLLASVASAHPRRPYTIDEPRVKTVVADFLGVPAARINWKCIAPPDGPANWYHPIDVTLPDPPASPQFDPGHSINIDVDPKWYYVRSVHWRDRWPAEGQPVADLITLVEARKLAWRYAISKSHCPPSRMKLRYGAAFQQNRRLLCFEWEQWDGDLNTGTRVSVDVNATPPGQVCTYYAHISRPWPRSAFRVSKDVAIEAAKRASRALGLEDPWVIYCKPYLSSPWMERPNWEIALDYANRYGGFGHQVWVDARTGRVAMPRR